VPDVRFDCSTATGIYCIVSGRSSGLERRVIVSAFQCPVIARYWRRFDAGVLASCT
jgi:hypothetical protein